jgi:c-di-GMP-binding flagellar brake protein YcgR
MEERRRFVRLDMNVVVKWEKITEDSNQIVGDTDITKNISVGGICLIAYERLEVGDKLRLEIELPTKKTVSAKGRVVWINEFEVIGRGLEKRYDVGVEFIDIRDEDREEINKFVFTFLHVKSKG